VWLSEKLFWNRYAPRPLLAKRNRSLSNIPASQMESRMTNKVKSKAPNIADLRAGTAGSVLIIDADANFAGRPPEKRIDDLPPASPNLHVPAGQTTHE
jgi:hypothetical protein